MNIALENTEEYVNGQLKNSYGDTFIRGNNGKAPGQHICYSLLTLSNIRLQFFTSVLPSLHENDS